MRLTTLHKLIVACAALVGACLMVAAFDFDSYTTLPGYKAAAVFSSDPDYLYFAQGEHNLLAAATAARRACVAANPDQTDTQYCELVRLGETAVTSAADIKARVPRTPHPLFLWRYERGDSIVYLAGSVHILKPGLRVPPPQYQQAFEASTHLVMEVDLSAFTAQQLQYKTMQYAMLPQDQQLSDVLPPETFTRLDALTTQYGLPLTQLVRFKPAFVTQQLVVLAMMSAGYDPNQGVETFFSQQAQNKTVSELETIDFQLELLMNQPLQTQLSMVEDVLTQMPQLEPFTADLVTAWLSGDDAQFKTAFDQQAGASPEAREFMRQMMDDRNINMADQIAAYLQSDGRYFVLVGAAHYVGDNSIISLLARKGIHGERISSDQMIPR